MKLLYLILTILLVSTLVNSTYGQTIQTKQNYDLPTDPIEFMQLGFKTNEGIDETVQIQKSKLLFDVTPSYESDNITINALNIALDPSMTATYDNIRNKNSDPTIVVYPAFTQAAYEKGGFYDYYNKKCDTSCLTLHIPENIHSSFSANQITVSVLQLLNYKFITDIDIDKNPNILQKYRKVIMLHSEYVTKNEFDAITKHPNVVFLFPNALYAEIKTNYGDNTFTLIRGHGYPDPSVKNGFSWKYDNSKYEYNVKCDNWNFYKKENYTLMNCYPEFRVLYGPELLRELKMDDPSQIIDRISNWMRYPHDTTTANELLYDFEISGNHIPTWVQKPAGMLLDGSITKFQLQQILNYLSEKNIIH